MVTDNETTTRRSCVSIKMSGVKEKLRVKVALFHKQTAVLERAAFQFPAGTVYYTGVNLGRGSAIFRPLERSNGTVKGN
ncbi:unnamed protein product, partial [Iphiclides podalirius]